MRTLRLQLADLVRETSVLRERAAAAEALKREVHELGRQVLQERAKVQALGQELENPLNVHRCAPPHGYCICCNVCPRHFAGTGFQRSKRALQRLKSRPGWYIDICVQPILPPYP